MTDSEDFKTGFNLGEIQSDIKSIKESLARMETSMTRGGERMGKLEEGRSDCDRKTAVLAGQIVTIERDVDKLEKSKNWVVTGIIGSLLAAISQWVMGRK